MSVLDRVDAYLDSVPRTVATATDVGAFTLFVNRDTRSWPYYARPRRGGPPPTSADVTAVRSQQRDLGVAETFEWVHDLVPGLADLAADDGLHVVLHPLLVLGRARAVAPAAAELPAGARVRLVAPGDDAVLLGALVSELGFASPGTAVGTAGLAELALRASRPTDADRARVARSDRLIADGLLVQAVAEVDGGVVAVGWHQPVHDVPAGDGSVFAASEIVGVATLPAARHRGYGAAVTALLAADALARGCEPVLLSAGDDAVARVYERIGFVRVGRAGAAEPPG